GRNKDEGILSEEHKVQEEDLAHPFFEILSEEHKVQEEDLAHPFFDDTADQDAAVTADQDAAVTSDLERKSDETEEVNIEEK
ncbi:hypothetical protein Tco_0623533, partial [Tanacetum coccineum]